MKLFEYADSFAELFDSLDAIAEYEPQVNEDGQYVDDDGNIITDVEAYKAEMVNAWFDTLDGIEQEFEVKAENIAAYIKDTRGDAEKLKKEEEALKKRRKTKENAAERFTEYLLDSMKTINRTKIDTPKAKLGIRNNAESAQFENEKAFISWAKENAPKLLNYGEPKIYKNSVKAALKAGEKLLGAVLRRTQSLIIK